MTAVVSGDEALILARQLASHVRRTSKELSETSDRIDELARQMEISFRIRRHG